MALGIVFLELALALFPSSSSEASTCEVGILKVFCWEAWPRAYEHVTGVAGESLRLDTSIACC